MVHTSLLQYSRAVPLWLPVAHLVKLITWSNCLLSELTSSCCFFKLDSWSLVKALNQISAWVCIHSKHLNFYKGNQPCRRHTSSWVSRILPFLLISIIKLQIDFFTSFVTPFRFSSTCWSLLEITRETNLTFTYFPQIANHQNGLVP